MSDIGWKCAARRGVGAANFTFISSRYWSFAQKASVERSRRAGEQASKWALEQAGGSARATSAAGRRHRACAATIAQLNATALTITVWSRECPPCTCDLMIECRVPWVELRGCRVRDRLQLRGWRDSSWFLVRWPVGATAGATVRVLANKLLVITDYIWFVSMSSAMHALRCSVLRESAFECLRMSLLSPFTRRSRI